MPYSGRENKTPITGAIFDCDGTLLDSIGAWLSLQDSLAAQVDVVLTPQEVSHANALTLPETAQLFHERFGLGASPQEVLGIINETMYFQYENKVAARPGALDFVKALHERGVKCGVASATSPKLLYRALEVGGFTPYLDAIVSVDDVGASKREPTVYDRARELMGTPKESTWVFEDARYALDTLIAADYLTVGVYDHDESGTLEELSVAHVVIKDFHSPNLLQFL
ncbi:MAG: HAD family phosphatase [Coriobacteriaceae bacterium]|jgi:beta-phosphoglucomutase-like phosphatase (HAD superfamily)|nr:HAD family phosphatase [Coriobacteriaceae bacterium]